MCTSSIFYLTDFAPVETQIHYYREKNKVSGMDLMCSDELGYFLLAVVDFIIFSDVIGSCLISSSILDR